MAASASGQPPAKGFSPSQSWGVPGVKDGTPVSDCSRERSRLSLYRVPRTQGNTSLLFFLSPFLLLKETPTRFASEAEKPQEAQSKPGAVSAHNLLIKAFKTPIAAALLPERLVGRARLLRPRESR